MRVNETPTKTPAERRFIATGWLLVAAAVMAIAGATMWSRATSEAESDLLSAEMACAIRGQVFCDAEAEPKREVAYALFAGAALACLAGVIVGSNGRSPTEVAPSRASLVAELDGIDAMLAEGRLTADEHAAAKRRLLGTS
jgi:hypothetical protein